jgi:hypothetical protein
MKVTVNVFMIKKLPTYSNQWVGQPLVTYCLMTILLTDLPKGTETT